MHLGDLLDKSYQGYINAERYLNNGSPSGFSDTHTTSAYTHPKSATPSFKLKNIRFEPNILVETIGRLNTKYGDDGCIFIHPDIISTGELLKNIIYSVEGELLVAPTASGRTVLALEDKYFIKLAYPTYLGRLVRHMSGEIVRSAFEVTKQLVAALETKKPNSAFSILREDFGRVAHVPTANSTYNGIPLPLNANGYYELGVLFRELEPFPYIDEEEYLVPFFALFAQEHDPVTQLPAVRQDKPLLIQLFEKQDKSMHDFLLNDILFPLFNTYFDALIYAGVELEAHAQNMLLTIDKDCKVKRIVCRDLESAGRDVPVMEYMGIEHTKHGDYKYNIIGSTEPGQKYPKYYINHSFMFDFKLGEYLVTPIIDLAQTYGSLDRSRLENEIKEFNHQFINKLPSGFFPPDWCHYENVNWSQERKERTYIWQDNPKYR